MAIHIALYKYCFIIIIIISQNYVTSEGAVRTMFYILSSSPLLVTEISFYANNYFDIVSSAFKITLEVHPATL